MAVSVKTKMQDQGLEMDATVATGWWKYSGWEKRYEIISVYPNSFSYLNDNGKQKN